MNENDPKVLQFLQKVKNETVPPDSIIQVEMTMQGSPLGEFLAKSCGALHGMVDFPEGTTDADKAFWHDLLHSILNLGIATGATLYIPTLDYLDKQAIEQTPVNEAARSIMVATALQSFLDRLKDEALVNLKPKA